VQDVKKHLKELKYCKRKYSELKRDFDEELRRKGADLLEEELEKVKRELKFCKRKYSELLRKQDKNKTPEFETLKKEKERLEQVLSICSYQ
jgi:hypothetical protein